MHRLECGVQRYGWGKRGHESKVALFKQAQDNQFKVIDESQPFAELWMGTHSNCPSTIVLDDADNNNTTSCSLKEYIGRDAVRILGKDVCSRFYDSTTSSSGGLVPGDLPFLFKVLSIGQALSIQAHPDKKLARELHSRDPANYPDANHKPEMLVAISPRFEALCGFRPSGEIVEHFVNYPELVAMCGQDNSDLFIASVAKNESHQVVEKALRECFTSLMTKEDDFVRARLHDLKHRLESASSSSGVSITDRTDLDSLFLRLLAQYPGDVGCLSVYLLNYLQLRQGEAIYLGASVPHAYLLGDGVECMACSDNVVRAGLTPKFKDVRVLCDMLDYTMKSSEENTLHGQPHDSLSHVRLFRPGVDEFSVQEIRCSNNNNNKSSARFELPPLSTGSILIVVESSSGSARFEFDQKQIDARAGLVYFIDPESKVNLNLDSSEESSFLAFRAYADIKSPAS